MPISTKRKKPVLATSKTMRFKAAVSQNRKKGSMGTNVAGHAKIKSGKTYTIPVEIGITYLNNDFLRRLEKNDELEIELIIRKAE